MRCLLISTLVATPTDRELRRHLVECFASSLGEPNAKEHEEAQEHNHEDQQRVRANQQLQSTFRDHVEDCYSKNQIGIYHRQSC